MVLRQLEHAGAGQLWKAHKQSLSEVAAQYRGKRRHDGAYQDDASDNPPGGEPAAPCRYGSDSGNGAKAKDRAPTCSMRANSVAIEQFESLDSQGPIGRQASRVVPGEA